MSSIFDLIAAPVEIASAWRSSNRNDNDGSSGAFWGIALLVALLIGGCAWLFSPKPLTTEGKHRAWIAETLGGRGTQLVERVMPPAGPFKLARQGVYHYRSTSPGGDVIYVEAYPSWWSSTAYRYRCYEQAKRPLIGGMYWREMKR